MRYLVLTKEGYKKYSSPHKRGLIGVLPFVNSDMVVGTKEYEVSVPLASNYQALLAPYGFWDDWKWYLDRYPNENQEQLAALGVQLRGYYLTLPPEGSDKLYGLLEITREGKAYLREYNGQIGLKVRPVVQFDLVKGEFFTPEYDSSIPLTPEQLKLFIGK